MEQKNRIKQLRIENGLTQQELGQRFVESKDITVISRWERGIVFPSSRNLIELARIFNVDPEDIFLPSNKTD